MFLLLAVEAEAAVADEVEDEGAEDEGEEAEDGALPRERREQKPAPAADVEGRREYCTVPPVPPLRSQSLPGRPSAEGAGAAEVEAEEEEEDHEEEEEEEAAKEQEQQPEDEEARHEEAEDRALLEQ
jgi:hypothetical protein